MGFAVRFSGPNHRTLKRCTKQEKGKERNMPLRQDIHKVMVIGSGPIVIGQAAEFDYAGTQACRRSATSPSPMEALALSTTHTFLSG